MRETSGRREADGPEVAEWFAALPDPDARERLVHRFLPLAEHLAQRFTGRGESREDLEQVARLGLVHAIDRFDAHRGVQFSTFATVTIVGELKRHFRDKGWSIRVPRSLQESALLVNRAAAELWQELGRAPTVEEIAARADLPSETVLEAMEAVQAYSTASLEAPVGEDGATTGDLLGGEDPGFAVSDEWLVIAPLLRGLPTRERRILYLRFFEDKTQTEIAHELGISQMHVSRLLDRTLATLREADDEAPAG
ncbi:MAG: SigB/SigF/SigG family RNA polymerase sigma factor [Actinomycetota bacterium]